LRPGIERRARRLGLARAGAFLLAMVTTYNLRMLDLFRYGAALESWNGQLFLCASAGLYCVGRSSMWIRAAIVASAYWLFTSGHPQMTYYGDQAVDASLAGRRTPVANLRPSVVSAHRHLAGRDDGWNLDRQCSDRAPWIGLAGSLLEQRLPS
jgi:hypothetical protein